MDLEERRGFYPGRRHFFTLVTEGRSPLLLQHAGRLRDVFRYVKGRHPFAIDAIVILPDHLHTLWRLPPNDLDFSRRWSAIIHRFSDDSSGVSLRFWTAGLAEIGSQGFQHEEDWRRLMDLIHYDPVRHGYVRKPFDWEYGSFRRCVEGGLYDREWGANVPPASLLGKLLE